MQMLRVLRPGRRIYVRIAEVQAKMANFMNMNQQQPQAPRPCDELRDLLPAYDIGALDAQERQRVEQLLVQCPEVAAERTDYALLAEALLDSVEPLTPPPHLHDRLLARVRDDADSGPNVTALPSAARSRSWRWWGWAAASLVLLLGNVFWLWQWNQAQSELSQLREEQTRLLEFASSSLWQPVPLVDGQGNAIATVYWNPEEEEAWLVTDELPTLAAAETYQLWLIGEDAPQSAGLFQTDSAERGSLLFQGPQTLGSYQAVAISVEPAGGSPAPTSDPIALGEF